MLIGFCLFRYFPYGGLQRDFLRIALDVQKRGHEIRVYTLAWEGEHPDGFDIRVFERQGWFRHQHYEQFAQEVHADLAREPVERLVGFNKMPGLDYYYQADSCYADKALHQRGFWYRWLPRYHHFMDFERAVFGPQSETQLLMISPMQAQLYQQHVDTPRERMTLLPSGIDRRFLRGPDAALIRSARRQELLTDTQASGITPASPWLLFVGSGFRKKGLDRALRSFAALLSSWRSTDSESKPKPVLWVVGEDRESPFRRLAKRLNIADQVFFAGGRDDVDQLYQAADLLLLPAYDENTGTVILEAMAAGLPVLATENCGYSPHLQQAGSGAIVGSPFVQEQCDQALLDLVCGEDLAAKGAAGHRYVLERDVFTRITRAAERICQ